MAIHDAGMFTEKGIFPVKRYDKQAQFFYVTAP